MVNYMALLVDTIVCQLLRTKFYLLVLVVIMVSCKKDVKIVETETLPFYNTATFEAEWIKKEDPNYNKIHKIAPFSLLNQLGDTITNQSLKNSIYVTNFFFTTCSGICPKMTNNLEKLQQKYKDNDKIKLLSLSVTPWIDSVAVLKQYGINHNINASKWYLLTGPKEAIYTLARKSFFAEKTLGLQKSNDEFLHTESMLLIDTQGRIRGIYNATQVVDLERISEDIEVLIKEKY